MKAKKRIVGMLILFLIGLAFIVYALAGDGVKIISPTSGSNFTALSSTLFNVSFINGTDITEPSNATFYLNISGTWTPIGNTTIGCDVGATASSCAVALTNSTIPDGAYSLNATIYNSTGSVSVTNVANLSSIIIDSTKPVAFPSNISNPTNWGNYSQNLVLNVSVVDALTGVNSVLFNITNVSGQQNATLTASREGTSSSYSVLVNATHYPDGYFNITVYANDSVGNLNNSALVYRIIFDNTLPSITHSCDDYSVIKDDLITCTCSASDSLSGVNTSYGSSGVSFTASPSTASTGTNLQTTCTTQDRAGNSRTSTLYYNVTNSSTSTSSTSSSSSSSSSTSSNSSSTTNQTNSTSSSENLTTGAVNTLEGNQGNSATPEPNKKINYLLIAGILLVLATGFLIFLKIKRGKKFK